ncbi:hypothetical protein [Streptomyces sp. ISL-11]|uniref:hypothetical protein n=1 Tax=Streptomyces sp. ISL-11 TaxID=2819174 RepID=UPI001BE8DB3E|nr:hypothetical protein [Streptomyces sp. ISL-11]MBT2382268.1 hypothetical protein [Streptomyces sp. ISL-11]
MRIELRIRRVVLEAIEPRDAAAVRAALTSELAALLVRSAFTPPTSRHIRRATAPPVAATTDPSAFGRHLAHAVHGSLGSSAGGGR